MEKLAPIYIKFMLACYVGTNPHEQLGERCWNSSAGNDVRDYLQFHGLIDGENRPTDRGKAWVDFICSTPLPEVSWTLPKREAA